MGQNIMLAVHCKKTEHVDVKRPIADYIAMTYGPSQAADAGDDLEGIQAQRDLIVGMGGTLMSLRDTMAKYYRALATMETRFPISNDPAHVHVLFTWYDAFRTSKKCEQANIHFEKAAVMFNLASLQSQIALQTERTSDAGVKEAAKLFQEAAGSYAYLRDVASVRVEQPRPVDMSPECAAMLERLMLAQAQECVYEKAVADKKSPALLARIAKQVGTLYSEVAAGMLCAPLSTHFDRSWSGHVGVKAALYEVQALLDSAAGLHADDKIGAEIARLKDAKLALVAPKKDVRSCSKELQESVRAAEDSISRTMMRAERENATVYLQRIPPSGDLPAVAGAMLVKAIPPQLAASGEGLFTSVIPDNCARALSRYSDHVDSLARGQMELLEAASDDARTKLREWELPESLQALEAASVAALPEAVRIELEQIEDSGGVGFLQEMSTQIKAHLVWQELRRVAEEELALAEQALAAEASEDSELRLRNGAAWNRPASTALNSSLREKLASYRSNLRAASDSDTRSDAKLAAGMPTFAALSVDAAAMQMPRLQAPMVAVGSADPASIVATLRHALDSLNQLSSERASLEEALKAEKGGDNILPKIMASSDNYDALFQAELKKYDGLKEGIAQNVGRQAQLLGVLGSQQAAYKSAFGFTEWRQSCVAAAAGVRAHVASFREVRDNLSEGLRFYMSLHEAIGSLGQQIGDFCLTRRIQCEEMVEEQRRREADEARNLRAARDLSTTAGFQRMSLGSADGSSSGGGQPSAPSQGPQQYPPPYQAHSMPAAPPQHSQAPPPYYAPPPASGYGQQQPPQYQPPAHSFPPAPPPTQHHYGQTQQTTPYPPGPPSQHYSSAPAPPAHYSQQQSPAYGQPVQQQYGYGGAPSQQYGGAPYGGTPGGPPAPAPAQQQSYYGGSGGGGSGGSGYGQQPAQAPPSTTGSNPLWSGS